MASRRIKPNKLEEYVDHFRARVLQDALTTATAAHWHRRAAEWEWAAPRVSDYNGRATRAEIIERSRRCQAIAEACRHRAEFGIDFDPEADADEVNMAINELDEVA